MSRFSQRKSMQNLKAEKTEVDGISPPPPKKKNLSVLKPYFFLVNLILLLLGSDFIYFQKHELRYSKDQTFTIMTDESNA